MLPGGVENLVRGYFPGYLPGTCGPGGWADRKHVCPVVCGPGGLQPAGMPVCGFGKTMWEWTLLPVAAALIKGCWYPWASPPRFRRNGSRNPTARSGQVRTPLS